MKLNINDLSKLPDLKKNLVESNVSANAITSIEKALKNGLSFKRLSDLEILNLPEADIKVIGEVAGFGNAAPASANVKTFQYTFKPFADEKFFFGYQFVITYTDKNGFTIAESYPIEDTRIVYVDLDLDNILNATKVIYQVKSANGELVAIALDDTGKPKEEMIETEKAALANAVISVLVVKLNEIINPAVNNTYQVKGKLISDRQEKLNGYQIVIHAAVENLSNGSPDFFPVAFATTETNGYFVTSFLVFNKPDDINKVLVAKAIVSNEERSWELPVRLLKITTDGAGDAVTKSMIPPRLILFINEQKGDSKECDCGCNDLNFHEKKVLEEYSYYTVVRTTEPSIIADVIEEEDDVDIDEIFNTNTGIKVPLSVFRKYQASVNTLVKPVSILTAPGPTSNTNTPVLMKTAFNPALKSVFNSDLLTKVIVENKISNTLKGKNKRQFKGRTYLNPLNQIDWDDEPTIYQAASVAHGHLLHFKQEWLPDGYSIGDILYSLPLAPGQKKQIAVLDWERRESAANSQQLDYEETLNNTLVRDRDINEVINATLNENIKASSNATTAGFGAGIGGAVMGVFNGGTFGGLLGISGGKSSSGSSANQNSHRDSTASSMQSISDRTTQAASMIRSQRSTVIQTVSQGEKVQATAESVANYNHCHAITIQYFEVLRHFNIQTRLADVQECLFVPLQITPFDLEKCIRWRSTLEKRLFRRQLLKAFDAVVRILHEKENDENYYDSIGYPRNNFAEFPLLTYIGELYIEFNFFNTADGKLGDDVDLINFYKLFGIQLNDYRDRFLKDSELADIVGPRTIEFLLNTILIETDKGVDLELDLSLMSSFRQNQTLQVTIRQTAQTPKIIARNQIDAISIKIDAAKLGNEQATNIKQLANKYMKVKVRSGSLRYKMQNFSGSLFSGRIDNDLFADNDGVYIATLPTADELRNPRGEDIEAANNLLHHLNENLEYYHKCIWFEMTPERRYMLLDGIIAPGKANGRSVASVVENRLIGIAGNCLIMPVAPGNQLDPTIDETFDLFAQYYSEDNDPIRLSMPTKGVYAEAVMGKCNSCEEKDESRFWRWEESPVPDSPNTQILPLNTDTRRADPGNLQPKDFPAPVVNIQNAPNVPDPTGLQGMLQLIGKGDAFRDLTGLNQNQLNALATFQKSLDTAQAFGKEAAELAKAAAASKLIEDAKQNGTVSNDKAKELSEKNIKAAIPATNDETMDQAKKQLDLIKTLEEQGSLKAEDAQNARKSILDNLTKAIDKNATSAGELGSLMEKASQLGTNVKKDGDAFEIATNGSPSGPLIIDVGITASLRAFGPPGNITGKTTLSVKPSNSNVPEGSTLRWVIPAGETGKYTITQQMRGVISEVEITGIQPGISNIAIQLIEPGGAIIASQIHPLSIPQFITIDDQNAKFGAFITARNLQAIAEPILDQAREVIALLLQKEANVRLIWKSKGTVVPVHIPANLITTLIIENNDTSGGGNYGISSPGPASGGKVGDTVFDEIIHVFPESYFDDGFTGPDVDTATNELVAILATVQASVPELEAWQIKFIGRLLGETISHEIYHTLLPVPFTHNPSPLDLMDQGNQRSFTERTGIVALSTPPGEFLDHLADNGIASINKLTGANLTHVHTHFPVPPAPPFDK